MPERTLRKQPGSMVSILAIALLLATSHAGVQDPEDAVRRPRRVVSFEHVNQELVLKCDVGRLILKPYADNIVHVRYYPDQEKESTPRWGIVATGAASATKYRVDSTLAAIRLSTAQMTVNVDRRTAQVSVLDAKQNVLVSSKQFRLESTKVAGIDTFSLRAEFVANEEEAYYGLGQHGNGWMDLRGQDVPLWHDARAAEGEVIAVPFLVTNRKYGLIFDSPSRSSVSPGKDGVTLWTAEACNALSYFVITGSNTDDLYRGYRLLTGTTPMPPKAALGFIMGTRRPAAQDPSLLAVRAHREKGLPADMLAIRPREAEDDPKPWLDPSGWNAELGSLGCSAILSVGTLLPKGTPNLDTLDTMGCVVKDKNAKPGANSNTSLLDVTKPSCASWFWNGLQERFASAGFTNWWLDGNEAGLLTNSSALDAGNGVGISSLYPWFQAKSIYEGFRSDRKERSLILARFGYLGAQQYATSFGAPEISPQWDALRRQVAAGLGMTASGMPYWSSAMGSTGTAGASTADDAIELYLRWFEFGAFCPTFRAQSPPLDTLGRNAGENAARTIARYLNLRYRLLPYIYSLAHVVTETGAPIMRALFMDFPLDPEVRDIKDEYMFGPALLVAPVIEKGKTARDVYLPKGTAWYDYWTGKKYQGGQKIPAEAPLDVLPLFVRAGTILPLGNEISDTRKAQREVEIRVYPGADSLFELYQDDGTTYEYEKGKFSLAQLRWTESTQKLVITGDDRKLFARPQEAWLRIIR
jgi:alpha-D-xyloside xylohydrolase